MAEANKQDILLTEPGYFKKHSFIKVHEHTLAVDKALSGHFLELCVEFIKPFVVLFTAPMNRLHLRLRRGERRKCLYKEQTSWRQEGRNEKAAWKEQIRADIWTLNPAHHWAPWPQRLSHNSDRGENRHTFQRWWRRRRRRRKSRLRWNTGLWEPHDKRLLLASMWGGSLCGRELHGVRPTRTQL